MQQTKIEFLNLALAFGCLVLAAGCASLSARTGSIKGNETTGLYVGTRLDGELIADYSRQMFDHEIGPCLVLASPIAMPILIGETSLSAAIDTLCLPYDLIPKPDPKPVVQREERPEIKKLRELWPQVCFKGDLYPAEGPWLCNAIFYSVKLEHYRQCRQIVLECGWLPDEPVSKIPSTIPGPFTTIPETFHRDARSLTISYMDWGVRLRSK